MKLTKILLVLSLLFPLTVGAGGGDDKNSADTTPMLNETDTIETYEGLPICDLGNATDIDQQDD